FSGLAVAPPPSHRCCVPAHVAVPARDQAARTRRVPLVPVAVRDLGRGMGAAADTGPAQSAVAGNASPACRPALVAGCQLPATRACRSRVAYGLRAQLRGIHQSAAVQYRTAHRAPPARSRTLVGTTDPASPIPVA